MVVVRGHIPLSEQQVGLPAALAKRSGYYIGLHASPLLIAHGLCIGKYSDYFWVAETSLPKTTVRDRYKPFAKRIPDTYQPSELFISDYNGHNSSGRSEYNDIGELC